MGKIIIETKDKSKLDLVKSMLEAMRIGFEEVEDRGEMPENPSPSGDPFFSDPKNLKELDRRLEGLKKGTAKPISLSKEELAELLKAK